MKIAVLCGGLSNERDVSISTGTGAARALRERGHQVALMDLFLGYDRPFSDPAEVFSARVQVSDWVYDCRSAEQRGAPEGSHGRAA